MSRLHREIDTMLNLKHNTRNAIAVNWHLVLASSLYDRGNTLSNSLPENRSAATLWSCSVTPSVRSRRRFLVITWQDTHIVIMSALIRQITKMANQPAV
jgi:hypothetical protein